MQMFNSISKMKKIYFGLLLVITILVSVSYFSYAFFTHKDEQHGKLNIVAGSLNYKIESSKLDDNNSIVVPSGLTRRFDIKITSLNEINSKYELYYTTDNNDVEVDYTSLSVDNPSGIVNSNSSKTISVRINNESSSDATVTFNVSGGFIDNDLALNDVKHINALCDNVTTFCISTTEQLVTLANEVNAGDSKSGKTYYLENDLDLGGKFDSEGNMLEGSTNWTPIGDYETSIAFSGTFDGDGHIIRNLYINSSETYPALFGYIYNGTIRKLGIEDSYIKSESDKSANAIVAVLSNSTMELCYNKATVDGGKSSSGLSRMIAKGSVVKNCYNGGNITGTTQFTAGLVGYSSDGTIKNSYNYGTVSGSGTESGGICGGNAGTITDTYNIGSVSGTSSVGGIAGHLYVNSLIQNSYNAGIISANGGGIVGNIFGNNNQQLLNNFYLNTTASYGIYKSSNDNFESQSDNEITPLDASEMPSILSVINGGNAFMEDTLNINNGNPILKWELQYK